MELPDEDRDFLERIQATLPPNMGSLPDRLEVASRDEIRQVWENCGDEASEFSMAILLATCPILSEIILPNIELSAEFSQFRDTFLLYGLSLGYVLGQGGMNST